MAKINAGCSHGFDQKASPGSSMWDVLHDIIFTAKSTYPQGYGNGKRIQRRGLLDSRSSTKSVPNDLDLQR